MPASEQMLRINISDGAGGLDIHIAANQHRAHRGAWLQRLWLLGIAHRARPHHGYDSRGSELRSEAVNRIFRKSVEYQWRLNGLEIIRKSLSSLWTRLPWPISRRPSPARDIPPHTIRGRPRRSFLRWTAIERIDLQHVGNRSHAGNRLFGKLANAERQSTRQLAVQIHRTSAHARNHAGVLDLFPMQAHQDDVTLGAIHVAQNAKHFHVHGFRPDALKHGIGDAAHASVNMVDGNRREIL